MKPAMQHNGATTLREGKAWLKEQFDTGAICPCCNQGVKLRRQQIHRTMAKALIVMARETEPGQWVRINKLLKLHQRLIGVDGKWGSDVVKLKLWGFLESKVYAKDEEGRRAGVWRITDAGRAFAMGATDALKYQYTYNGKRVSRENAATERANINACLGAPFCYAEAMGALPDGSAGDPL